MAATELQTRPAAAAAGSGGELNGKLARQVADILAEASPRQPARPALAYRVPAPGVRYYF